MYIYSGNTCARYPHIFRDLKDKMDRVLGTPELLDLIFDYTDHETDVACVTVNKGFFEASVKRIWYKVDNLQRIFSILAPIVKVVDGEKVDYVRHILPFEAENSLLKTL